MTIFKSAFTVGGLTFISRILGYIRDIFIASSLGAGLLSDAFFVALRLPNLFRALSAEGAFNASFIPLFSGKLAESGKAGAVSFAERAMSLMIIILVIFTVIMQLFMPFVMHLLAPGFSGDLEKLDMAVELARIMFPYLIFISLVSLLSGVLNSVGKFAAAASAPIWLNFSMIISVIYLSEFTQTSAHALGWGVFIAGIIQVTWLFVAAYKSDVRLRLRGPKIDADIKMLFKRMIPGVIGGGVTQINLWVNTIIATTMASAVSYLYYADRMVQFPLAIIGTAMGVAILPVLSKHVKKLEIDKAIETQNRALELSLFLTIPAAAAFFVIAEPLISVMFERGAFGLSETQATSKALIAYSVGLPAFVMIKIFTPVFFANGDTKTPVKIAMACLVFNVVVSLSLINYIGYIALAISTAFTAWFNSGLLCYNLIKRGLYRADYRLLKRVVLTVISSVVMVAFLFFAVQYAQHYFERSFAYKLSALFAVIISGAVVFFMAAYITKAFRLSDFKFGAGGRI